MRGVLQGVCSTLAIVSGPSIYTREDAEHVCAIISLKITLREILDPQKRSTIQYLHSHRMVGVRSMWLVMRAILR